MTHIWFAADGGDDDLYDRSFGAPDEVRRRDGSIGEYAISDQGEGAPDDDARNPPPSQGAEGGEELSSNGEDVDRELAIGQHDLIEALQPITFKGCCVPAVYKGVHNPRDVDCYGTCYSERACNDTVYPFSSAEEKAMFPRRTLTRKGKNELSRECKYPESLVPPFEWCQRPHAEKRVSNETAAHLVNGIPPAGCRHITHGGGSGAFQHVIIFPSAKLAFCGIPKVGITQWEQFLRFYFGAKDYPSMPHYRLDRDFFQFDLLDPRVQRRIWEGEDWTWAAFIRNPAERLLSAYLDKVKTRELRWLNKKLTFEEFVDSLSRPNNFTSCSEEGTGGGLFGLSWCSDPHWRPQVYSCGLSERLDRFDFIGDLANVADQTKELLSHVGLWDSHGRHYINGGVKAGRSPWGCNFASHPHNHTIHVGFQQEDHDGNASAAETVYGHSKGSSSKMDEYYTPELRKRVEDELYANDYKLWKLVSANGKKLSKGRALVSQLSNKCERSSEKSEAKDADDEVSDDADDDAIEENETEKDQIDVDAADLAPVIAGIGTTSDGTQLSIEALEPPTLIGCCVPHAFKQSKGDVKDKNCFGTCYSKRACSDPAFPFRSMEEKAMFPVAEPTTKGRKELRQECMNPESLAPPVDWCQQPHVDSENGTAAHLIKGIPPAGCRLVSHAGGSGAFQHVLVFPSAKLAFCGIPKVGITQWEQFLRFYFGAKDYPALPHYKLDRELLQFDLLDPSVQRRIWEDEEWTWAAFIRNPAERLLSAYLDKVQKNNKKKLQSNNESISFSQFVTGLSAPLRSNNCKDNKGGMTGLSWCSDPRE